MVVADKTLTVGVKLVVAAPPPPILPIIAVAVTGVVPAELSWTVTFVTPIALVSVIFSPIPNL